MEKEKELGSKWLVVIRKGRYSYGSLRAFELYTEAEEDLKGQMLLAPKGVTGEIQVVFIHS